MTTSRALRGVPKSRERRIQAWCGCRAAPLVRFEMADLSSSWNDSIKNGFSQTTAPVAESLAHGTLPCHTACNIASAHEAAAVIGRRRLRPEGST
jgi:hypothetical protein